MIKGSRYKNVPCNVRPTKTPISLCIRAVIRVFCLPAEVVDPWLFSERKAKTLIKLRGYTGWS